MLAAIADPSEGKIPKGRLNTEGVRHAGSALVGYAKSTEPTELVRVFWSNRGQAYGHRKISMQVLELLGPFIARALETVPDFNSRATGLLITG